MSQQNHSRRRQFVQQPSHFRGRVRTIQHPSQSTKGQNMGIWVQSNEGGSSLREHGARVVPGTQTITFGEPQQPSYHMQEQGQPSFGHLVNGGVEMFNNGLQHTPQRDLVPTSETTQRNGPIPHENGRNGVTHIQNNGSLTSRHHNQSAYRKVHRHPSDKLHMAAANAAKQQQPSVFTTYQPQRQQSHMTGAHSPPVYNVIMQEQPCRGDSPPSQTITLQTMLQQTFKVTPNNLQQANQQLQQVNQMRYTLARSKNALRDRITSSRSARTAAVTIPNWSPSKVSGVRLRDASPRQNASQATQRAQVHIKRGTLRQRGARSGQFDTAVNTMGLQQPSPKQHQFQNYQHSQMRQNGEPQVLNRHQSVQPHRQQTIQAKSRCQSTNQRRRQLRQAWLKDTDKVATDSASASQSPPPGTNQGDSMMLMIPPGAVMHSNSKERRLNQVREEFEQWKEQSSPETASAHFGNFFPSTTQQANAPPQELNFTAPTVPKGVRSQRHQSVNQRMGTAAQSNRSKASRKVTEPNLASILTNTYLSSPNLGSGPAKTTTNKERQSPRMVSQEPSEPLDTIRVAQSSRRDLQSKQTESLPPLPGSSSQSIQQTKLSSRKSSSKIESISLNQISQDRRTSGFESSRKQFSQNLQHEARPQEDLEGVIHRLLATVDTNMIAAFQSQQARGNSNQQQLARAQIVNKLMAEIQESNGQYAPIRKPESLQGDGHLHTEQPRPDLQNINTQSNENFAAVKADGTGAEVGEQIGHAASFKAETQSKTACEEQRKDAPKIEDLGVIEKQESLARTIVADSDELLSIDDSEQSGVNQIESQKASEESLKKMASEKAIGGVELEDSAPQVQKQLLETRSGPQLEVEGETPAEIIPELQATEVESQVEDQVRVEVLPEEPFEVLAEVQEPSNAATAQESIPAMEKSVIEAGKEPVQDQMPSNIVEQTAPIEASDLQESAHSQEQDKTQTDQPSEKVVHIAESEEEQKATPEVVAQTLPKDLPEALPEAQSETTQNLVSEQPGDKNEGETRLSNDRKSPTQDRQDSKLQLNVIASQSSPICVGELLSPIGLRDEDSVTSQKADEKPKEEEPTDQKTVDPLPTESQQPQADSDFERQVTIGKEIKPQESLKSESPVALKASKSVSIRDFDSLSVIPYASAKDANYLSKPASVKIIKSVRISQPSDKEKSIQKPVFEAQSSLQTSSITGSYKLATSKTIAPLRADPNLSEPLRKSASEDQSIQMAKTQVDIDVKPRIYVTTFSKQSHDLLVIQQNTSGQNQNTQGLVRTSDLLQKEPDRRSSSTSLKIKASKTMRSNHSQQSSPTRRHVSANNIKSRQEGGSISNLSRWNRSNSKASLKTIFEKHQASHNSFESSSSVFSSQVSRSPNQHPRGVTYYNTSGFDVLESLQLYGGEYGSQEKAKLMRDPIPADRLQEKGKLQAASSQDSLHMPWEADEAEAILMITDEKMQRLCGCEAWSDEQMVSIVTPSDIEVAEHRAEAIHSDFVAQLDLQGDLSQFCEIETTQKTESRDHHAMLSATIKTPMPKARSTFFQKDKLAKTVSLHSNQGQAESVLRQRQSPNTSATEKKLQRLNGAKMDSVPKVPALQQRRKNKFGSQFGTASFNLDESGQIKQGDRPQIGSLTLLRSTTLARVKRETTNTLIVETHSSVLTAADKQAAQAFATFAAKFAKEEEVRVQSWSIKRKQILRNWMLPFVNNNADVTKQLINGAANRGDKVQPQASMRKQSQKDHVANGQGQESTIAGAAQALLNKKMLYNNRNMVLHRLIDYMLLNVSSAASSLVAHPAAEAKCFINLQDLGSQAEQETSLLISQLMPPVNGYEYYFQSIQERLEQWGLTDLGLMIERNANKSTQSHSQDGKTDLSSGRQAKLEGSPSWSFMSDTKSQVLQATLLPPKKVNFIKLEAYSSALTYYIQELTVLYDKKRSPIIIKPMTGMLDIIKDQWVEACYQKVIGRYAFDTHQAHEEWVLRKKLRMLTGTVKRDRQETQFIERLFVKSADIPYYLFDATPDNYIRRRLLNQKSQIGKFHELWLNAYQCFQVIYMNDQITQKKQRRKRTSTRDKESKSSVGSRRSSRMR